MGTQQPIRKTVTPEIPDKLYFRIGDVSRLCEVPTYVLRFWETEFPQLKPNKGGTGQRLYRRRDVELALRIKSLLYDQGYTIPGARQVFKNESAARSAEAAVPAEPVTGAAPPASFGTHGIQANPPEDSGLALRRAARLRDLREDMAALLLTLSSSPSSTVATGAAPVPPSRPESKVQTMRPRLVLEPRPTTTALPAGNGPRLQLSQRDLFGGEANVSDEWPEPPVAS